MKTLHLFYLVIIEVGSKLKPNHREFGGFSPPQTAPTVHFRKPLAALLPHAKRHERQYK
jgi:hypothetical protein